MRSTRGWHGACEAIAPMNEPLLAIEDLKTHFFTRDGVVRAVDGVSATLGAGETLAVVGESGCGKSVTALSILRLVPTPPGRIVGGTIRFGGVDLLRLPEAEMRRIRGNEISMIFQEPMTSLNPVLTIARQIGESLVLHQGFAWRKALMRAVDMLALVHIPEPKSRARQYPHELSGGMRQRVMIAMALACHPKLLIADEPTTALDVTIQAQILDLMRELKSEIGAAIILITHDLGIVAEMAERVVVMYAGRKVEEAPVRSLFRRPRHPYTLGLLGSVPRLGSTLGRGEAPRLAEIPGTVPSLREAILGCAFAPRCPYAVERCRREMPPLEAKAPDHLAACFESDRLEPP
jgi:peptide/nickel transport system ATP-binding protein